MLIPRTYEFSIPEVVKMNKYGSFNIGFICKLLFSDKYFSSNMCLPELTEIGHETLCYGRTVWYELLCGEWPFKGQPPEPIIWQVGKGAKQPLANLQASRDVKVNYITLFCILW